MSLRARRRAFAPSRARGVFEAVWRSDLRGALDSIAAPTLVMYRHDPRQAMDEHARYLATHIADARLVALPGDDAAAFLGDTDATLDVVREFLTGTRTVDIDRLDRVLATVLFTDIVNSTAQAADLGDRVATTPRPSRRHGEIRVGEVPRSRDQDHRGRLPRNL